jgi:hypothetical protein
VILYTEWLIEVSDGLLKSNQNLKGAVIGRWRQNSWKFVLLCTIIKTLDWIVNSTAFEFHTHRLISQFFATK